MTQKDKIANELSSILPDRPNVPITVPSGSQLVQQEAASIKKKQDAKELARIKFIEKQKLARTKAQQAKRESIAEELGIDLREVPESRTASQIQKIAEHEKKIEVIETLEAQDMEDPLHPIQVAKVISSNDQVQHPQRAISTAVSEAMKLRGTTRPEVVKLLTSLNINLNVQLTKQDTANLLACLLTCNESQLQALKANKKVPVAIKIVITRLLEDMKLGNMDTIDRLWDKIFGKGAMQLNLPEEQQLQTGIIPNVPISREAYIVIRDTLMK